MQTIKLYRYYDSGEATRGMLRLPSGKWIHTLERPWKQNARRLSCIPTGVYKTSYMAVSGSGKYKHVWHVTDVPGRSGILIHSGNYVVHTLGCILFGLSRNRTGKAALWNSIKALKQFNQEMKGQYFFNLEVINL